MKPYASQESIAETLTAGEVVIRQGSAMGKTEFVPPLLNAAEAAEERRQTAIKHGWRAGSEAPIGVPLYLLLDDNHVIKGWASRRFLSRLTFWSWDFALELEHGQVVPGYVEPLAWCIADPASEVAA